VWKGTGRGRGRSSLVSLVWARLTAVFETVSAGGSAAHAAPLLHLQENLPTGRSIGGGQREYNRACCQLRQSDPIRKGRDESSSLRR